MWRLVMCGFWGLLLAGSGAAHAADQPPRLAVLRFEGKLVDPALADAITELVLLEVGKQPKLHVIGQHEIESLLSFEQSKMLLGCDDAGCLTEVAGALGCDLLVSGSVMGFGETHVVSARLLDAHGARVVARASVEVEGAGPSLLKAVRRLVSDLFGEASPADLAPTPGPTDGTPTDGTPTDATPTTAEGVPEAALPVGSPATPALAGPPPPGARLTLAGGGLLLLGGAVLGGLAWLEWSDLHELTFGTAAWEGARRRGEREATAGLVVTSAGAVALLTGVVWLLRRGSAAGPTPTGEPEVAP